MEELIQIDTLALGDLRANCYLLYMHDQAIIIDPGAEPEKIIQRIEQNHLRPLAILLTHAHFDHIGAVDAIRNKYDIDVYLHVKEHDWLENPELNRSIGFIRQPIITSKPEQKLVPGKLQIGPFHFEVKHTPGHSPGSVSFIHHGQKFVISGDVLFQYGIGRTDLPGGSLEQLEQSIQNKLYRLDDAFTVYPGHGPLTTIGNEKYNNPFIRMDS